VEIIMDYTGDRCDTKAEVGEEKCLTARFKMVDWAMSLGT
jgi:hypothetical protein